jgi:hypothetical protein
LTAAETQMGGPAMVRLSPERPADGVDRIAAANAEDLAFVARSHEQRAQAAAQRPQKMAASLCLYQRHPQFGI